MSIEVDYLVIGSGLAGLTFALTAAPHGSVAVLTKRTRSDANSSLAQGGIAGVLSEDDSFELHKQDTLVAGAGICHEDAVDILVHEGPERIKDLMGLGANFNTVTANDGATVLALGREGGHSRNRIVHTADYTGWECERTLLEAVKADKAIQVYEHYFVLQLLTFEHNGRRYCAGALALNTESGQVETVKARYTLLATGGCGQVYEHTTNPVVATGDGVALAWNAGVPVANMEFIQFHPTTLYHPNDRAFLITEALRGEGGILRTADGDAFMSRYHHLKELAPRDIVARAIESEMKRTEQPCVYLDATHISNEILHDHFPTVMVRCAAVGIDITRDPIPIAPAQHYQCGGVNTDLDGATCIGGLFAAGEVACTGVHGANRLASNSLLEAMVFGYRAARKSTELHNSLPLGNPDKSTAIGSVDASLASRLGSIRTVIREEMQRSVGIVRTTSELERVASCLRMWRHEISNDAMLSADAMETKNIALLASLIVSSALRRHESRGLHYTLDYPTKLDAWKHDTMLIPSAESGL